MNKAPKFSKVEILLKLNSPNTDLMFESRNKLEFLDCGLVLSGDYIIVVIDERKEKETSQTTTGNIFNMKDVVAYKTYAI